MRFNVCGLNALTPVKLFLILFFIVKGLSQVWSHIKLLLLKDIELHKAPLHNETTSKSFNHFFRKKLYFVFRPLLFPHPQNRQILFFNKVHNKKANKF